MYFTLFEPEIRKLDTMTEFIKKNGTGYKTLMDYSLIKTVSHYRKREQIVGYMPP